MCRRRDCRQPNFGEKFSKSTATRWFSTTCPLAALHCDLSIFDLAVLDFQMPGLNGRELFLRMRALGAQFPIILLTGSVDALSYEDCVLFARCLDNKSRPIPYLLEAIAGFLNPNQFLILERDRQQRSAHCHSATKIEVSTSVGSLCAAIASRQIPPTVCCRED